MLLRIVWVNLYENGRDSRFWKVGNLSSWVSRKCWGPHISAKEACHVSAKEACVCERERWQQEPHICTKEACLCKRDLSLCKRALSLYTRPKCSARGSTGSAILLSLFMKKKPYLHKWAPYLRKRALHPCQRDLHFCKRAPTLRKRVVFVRKRALYLCKRTQTLCTANEPYPASPQKTGFKPCPGCWTWSRLFLRRRQANASARWVQ